MNKNNIISFLTMNKQEYYDKFNITRLALFGSYAKGLEHDDSDIDIVIEMENNNYFKLIAFENFISEKLDRKVDVGFFSSMKSFIKKSIEKDLVYV
jgi:predicted nucleotidyltransferase